MLSVVDGYEIRSDSAGDGHYLAKRGSRYHRGVDYLAVPGANAYAPLVGYIVREAYPYKNDYEYKGVIFQAKSIALKIFYIDPILHLVGHKIKAGTVIGIVQDVSKKYNKVDSDLIMLPHVHVEVADMDINLLIGRL